MDSTNTTGDPWDLPENEAAEEAAPVVAGGISPLAQSTGLFGRSTTAVETAAEMEEPSTEDQPAEPVVSADEQVEEFLQELEAVTQLTPDEPAAEDEGDTSFELIPPPPPEAPIEDYSPSDETADPAADEFRTALNVTHADEVDDAPPAAAPDAAAPVPEPDIEFGAPNAPEGAEEPTGKAVRAANDGVISRAMLLTTNTIEGATVAPVDMVVAVETAVDPLGIPMAMDSALNQLRAATETVGAEAVVAVTTNVVSINGSIVVTASGTAVNLL